MEKGLSNFANALNAIRPNSVCFAYLKEQNMHYDAIRKFDLNLLKSLDALMMEKNITRAARLINVSQSTMSGTFRRLRDEFNDPILIRRGRYYELSPVARSLQVSVRQILLQIEATVSFKTLFDPTIDQRHFRLMATDYDLVYFLGKTLQGAAMLAPGITFEVLPPGKPIDDVRSGLIDMSIAEASAEEIEQDGLLRADLVYSGSYGFVVDQNHPLNGIASIEDVRKYPLILTQFFLDNCSLATGFGASNPLKAQITVSGFAAMPRLITGSDFLGLLPRGMYSLAARHNLRILEVDFKLPPLERRLVWHSRLAFDPIFSWLRNMLLDSQEGDS